MQSAAFLLKDFPNLRLSQMEYQNFISQKLWILLGFFGVCRTTEFFLSRWFEYMEVVLGEKVSLLIRQDEDKKLRKTLNNGRVFSSLVIGDN